MSLTRILPSMIDSTAASDGDALVYSAANARFEFGAAASGGSSALGSIANNTLDLSTGNFFEVTADDQMLSFSNPPPVHRFTLKVTGAGVETGFSYDNISYSASSVEGPVSSDLAFNSDGTKMYIISYAGTVYQYSLSTAYVINTASYDSVSFSLKAQGGEFRGITFSATGSTMFASSASAYKIFQYSLSTPFDISTASYSNISLSTVSQDYGPRNIAFNSSGSRFFMLGNGNNKIYQYNLTQAFDLSSASYSSIDYTVAANPYGMVFNSDGTKMYVSDLTSNGIREHNLSAGFDLSSASSSVNYYNIYPTAVQAIGLDINSDGSKLFVINGSNQIYQYTLPSVTATPITYPSSVNFKLESPPTAPAIGKVNTLELYTVDGGINYYQY